MLCASSPALQPACAAAVGTYGSCVAADAVSSGTSANRAPKGLEREKLPHRAPANAGESGAATPAKSQRKSQKPAAIPARRAACGAVPTETTDSENRVVPNVFQSLCSSFPSEYPVSKPLLLSGVVFSLFLSDLAPGWVCWNSLLCAALRSEPV